jgi:Arylsulfotransferase (ASST)
MAGSHGGRIVVLAPSFYRNLLATLLLVLVPVAALAALGCSPEPSFLPSDGGGEGGVTDSTSGLDGSVVPPVDAGPAYLTALAVSGPSGSIGLTPAFSPGTFDYYVRCPADTANALTVAFTPAPGATSAAAVEGGGMPDGAAYPAGPSSPSSPSSQTLTLSVNANQAVVATAKAGSAENQYWVRCLPPTFPSLYQELYTTVGTPTPGYYILGNSGDAPGYAMIIDSNGVPVWYFLSTQAGIDDADSVVAGTVSFFSTWTSDPATIRHLSPPTTTTAIPQTDGGTMELDSHELRALPNGHFLVFSYPLVTGLNLTGLQGFNVAEAGVDGTQIFNCVIVEFDPTKTTNNVVWTWNAMDHFDVVKDSTSAGLSNQLGVIAVDAFHCNSIDVDPDNGNLLVSSRNMSSVFYVDRSTPEGKVVWKLGGESYSKDNATFIPVADPFMQQHDARLHNWSEATGTGQISVFDDQSNTGYPARGLLMDVTTGVGGKTPKATTAWDYKAGGSSANRGSFRIQSDGSRVIGWGQNVSIGHVFTEVDSKGNVVKDFYFPMGYQSYRAVKFPLGSFDLGLMRTTSGF